MADNPPARPGSGRQGAARGVNRHLRRVNTEPGEPLMVFAIRLINAILGPFTHRDWRGQHHIPQTGGVLLVANHISNVDPLALAQYIAYSGRWPRFLAKASLFDLPVIGHLARGTGQIPVHRDSSAARDAARQAEDAIESGRAVVIYPEATITLDPDLWPMDGRFGAARIALETGCPVIPIGQWGAQDIMWGKKIHFPKLLPRKTLRLIAGPPVSLADLRDRPVTAQVLAEATDRLLDEITALVATLREQDPPAQRHSARRSAPSASGQTPGGQTPRDQTPNVQTPSEENPT